MRSLRLRYADDIASPSLAEMHGLEPLDKMLERSISTFNAIIRDRRRRGDEPRDPAKILTLGEREFGLVEWPDGRWLVLPLEGDFHA